MPFFLNANQSIYHCKLLIDGDVCTLDASAPDGFTCSCSDDSQYLDDNNDCQGNISIYVCLVRLSIVLLNQTSFVTNIL